MKTTATDLIVVEAYGVIALSKTELRDIIRKLISPFAPKVLIRCHEGESPLYRRAQLLLMVIPRYLKDVQAIFVDENTHG